MPYFINKDNKYEPLVSRNSRAYYQMNGNVTPFPPGFRMVSGDAMKRDEKSPRVAGLGFAFACNGDNPQKFYLPTGKTYATCNFLRMQVTFPSCGLADQTLDSPNHSDHVVFPIEKDGDNAKLHAFRGGRCPPSHPIKYPTIHLEMYFSMTDEQAKQWRTDGSPNFILSNGDTVGTSVHADFVNGWDTDAQKKMIYDCASNPGNSAEECPGLQPFKKVSDAENCRFAGMIPDEDIGYGKPLDLLPGCNTRWDANTPNKPGCTARPNPGWVGPNGALRISGYASEALPVALDVGSQDISTVKPSLGNFCKFEDWNKQTWWFRDRGTNQDQWIKSTPADIKTNLMDTNAGANKHPKVFGMQDSSAYTATKPSGTVPGQDQWFTTSIVPPPKCTSNGLMPC